MSQEPQSPLWPEAEIKTIGKREVAGTFGERLKRERELRSITLDEMAASTKIGTRMLHALEDEEFEKLPGGIFNKGFVRAYAKYLGLDEEQSVIDYLAAEAEQERRRRSPGEPADARQSQPQLFAIQGGARPDNVYNIRASVEIVENPPDPAGGFLKAAVILVFVLGIGGFLWKYSSSHSSGSASAASRGVQSQPAPTPAPVVSTPAQSIQSPESSSAVPTGGQATAANATETPAKATKYDATDQTSRDSASAAALSSTSSSGEFTLDLRADDDSWAQVISDGKTVWSGVIAKDSAKSFRASKEMTLKLGNAPGVQLAYNGKSLPRFAQDPAGSKTRNLTFTPNGLQPR